MRRLSSSVTRADAQLAATRQAEDPVDPLGEAPEVGQRREQLVADELLAVDDGVGRRVAASAAPTSSATVRG